MTVQFYYCTATSNILATDTTPKPQYTPFTIVSRPARIKVRSMKCQMCCTHCSNVFNVLGSKHRVAPKVIHPIHALSRSEWSNTRSSKAAIDACSQDEKLKESSTIRWKRCHNLILFLFHHRLHLVQPVMEQHIIPILYLLYIPQYCTYTWRPGRRSTASCWSLAIQFASSMPLKAPLAEIRKTLCSTVLAQHICGPALKEYMQWYHRWSLATPVLIQTSSSISWTTLSVQQTISYHTHHAHCFLLFSHPINSLHPYRNAPPIFYTFLIALHQLYAFLVSFPTRFHQHIWLIPKWTGSFCHWNE